MQKRSPFGGPSIAHMKDTVETYGKLSMKLSVVP